MVISHFKKTNDYCRNVKRKVSSCLHTPKENIFHESCNNDFIIGNNSFMSVGVNALGKLRERYS